MMAGKLKSHCAGLAEFLHIIALAVCMHVNSQVRVPPSEVSNKTKPQDQQHIGVSGCTIKIKINKTLGISSHCVSFATCLHDECQPLHHIGC